MSKVIQTVEELDAVLHWRGKHAQAIRERDALRNEVGQVKGEYDRAVNKIDALQERLTAAEGQQLACMPVERCYDVRAKMIIAFNEAKKAGGDLDDALDAAYKSALRYSPNPLSADQGAPVAVASRDESIAWLKRIDGIGQNRAELIYSMNFRLVLDSTKS